ncbi:uncharacterized protein LOC107706847 [Sinocyclocheilus rhinocerous]|uniref:uncharacterized protein LOC107706847 n=1 Tax=Sinocyclocheilus rhinocerous TaxID=307959 RepID=UPI0007B80F90|nr:PREDICTED: uncharacterized protein LOC107706847 [Sinocyclocheilus rhinocerous]
MRQGSPLSRNRRRQAWNTCHCGMCSECTGECNPSTLCVSQGKPQPSFHQGCCTGTANKSGWIQDEDFLEFLCHFQTHTRASPTQMVLLILGNHHSHMSLRGIDFCRESGIILLSYPPHCSHKLQPLDRSVFGPFKMVYSFSDSWMRHHPGTTMSIYDIPAIVRDSFPMAATPSDIQAGFRCTGIWPFNRDIFSDAYFAPSCVTDRPHNPETSVTGPASTVSVAGQFSTSTVPATASISGTPYIALNVPTTGPFSTTYTVPSSIAFTRPAAGTSSLINEDFSPILVRPFPKAGP